MTSTRMAAALAAACAFFAVEGAWAQPTPGQLLDFKPKREIVCSTPTADEVAKCQVSLDKPAAGGKGSGWLFAGGRRSGNAAHRGFGRVGTQLFCLQNSVSPNDKRVENVRGVRSTRGPDDTLRAALNSPTQLRFFKPFFVPWQHYSRPASRSSRSSSSPH